MVELLEAPTEFLVSEDSALDDALEASTEHVLIDNFGESDFTTIARRKFPSADVANYAKSLNEVYYRGQARQFGFWIPLDPSRVNGVAYPVRDEPKREDFGSSEGFEKARSDFADALSSQEKHALSGVPFN